MKASDTKKEYKLILFISGMSMKSMNAVNNLRKICDTYLQDNFELETIDINVEQHQAAKHQIIALPTLIKVEPGPPRIILGDLSDTEKVLRILNIEPKA